MDRDIQGRYRFIADNEARPKRQGAGNPNALPLTARKFVRVAASVIIFQANLFQHLDRHVVAILGISDAMNAQAFGDRLLESPRSFADRTSISGALEFAMAQLDKAPFDAPRRTIDVSGDGTNNAGRDVKLARDEVLAKGVTINGLVILSDHPLSWNAEHTNPPGGLDRYYQDSVVGGPGAFVMVAQNFNSFGQAIINKMIAEIAVTKGRRYAALLPMLLGDPAHALAPISFRAIRTE